jgi:hypothetical protein
VTNLLAEKGRLSDFESGGFILFLPARPLLLSAGGGVLLLLRRIFSSSYAFSEPSRTNTTIAAEC